MEKSEVYRILNEAYFSPAAHESSLLRSLVPLLRTVRSFADVGASLGQYTEFANRQLSDADILAVEADPLRFEELQRNCSKWGAMGRNRLRAINMAVADRSGSLEFHTSESNVSGRLDAPTGASSWRKVRVPSISLDELFPGQAPDFIKMDIEGAEFLAVSGGQRVLGQRRTLLLVELHWFGGPDGKGTHSAVTKLMRGLGYHRIWLHDHWLFVPEMRGYRELRFRMALLRVVSAARRRLARAGAQKT